MLSMVFVGLAGVQACSDDPVASDAGSGGDAIKTADGATDGGAGRRDGFGLEDSGTADAAVDGAPASDAVAISDGAATKPADTAAIVQACKAMCQRRVKCQGKADTCATDCSTSKLAHLDQIYLDAYIQAFLSCMKTLSCQQITDTCAAKALSAVSSNPSAHPLYKSCTSRRATCQKQGQTFSDDWCAVMPALAAKGQTAAKQCLAKTCGQIGSCLEATLDY